MNMTEAAIKFLEQDLENESISEFGLSAIWNRLNSFKKNHDRDTMYRYLGSSHVDRIIYNIVLYEFGGNFESLLLACDEDLQKVRRLGAKSLKRIHELQEQWKTETSKNVPNGEEE